MKISNEAVEAAARVMHEHKDTETTFGAVARLALEAAAPFILAAAWDEGYAAGDMPCEIAVPCGDCPTCNMPAPTDPYRTQP